MSAFDIYLCGVGGQGIGLLAAVLGRACITAGHEIHGCDTHGVAQRHGVVASHLRLGPGARTPRVRPGGAALVLALERLEALRAARLMLAPGGTLLYYETVYQPMEVRLGRAAYPQPGEVAAAVAERGGTLRAVHLEALEDARLQNAALLGALAATDLLPGGAGERLEAVLAESVPAAARAANLRAFAAARAGSSAVLPG